MAQENVCGVRFCHAVLCLVSMSWQAKQHCSVHRAKQMWHRFFLRFIKLSCQLDTVKSTSLMSASCRQALQSSSNYLLVSPPKIAQSVKVQADILHQCRNGTHG